MFGFWIKAKKNYSAQCPACEKREGVKFLEALFGGVLRYECKLCGCTWMYKNTDTEGKVADAHNSGLVQDLVRT